MFGVDWNDPATLWLNLTNLGLGMFVLGSVVILAGSVFAELFAKLRATQPQARMRFHTVLDPHAMHTPELGLTMADGGEPQIEPSKPQPPSPKR